MNEDELIDGCVRQDVHFQKLLYEKYARKMMGVCMRYCNSRQEAEDVLQDAFIKIFDKIRYFEKKGSLEGWIRRIMVNSALKSNDKRVFKFEPGSLDYVQEPTIGSKAISNMETESLLRIIQELPDGYKAVFNMYAIEGYSHKEIAEELGISEVTSRTQYSRAKQYLVKLLSKYGIKRNE
ncbi:RNA polymerase sigma factor [bacterium]|nr:RNA polymerase sigma factor [bacterium]